MKKKMLSEISIAVVIMTIIMSIWILFSKYPDNDYVVSTSTRTNKIRGGCNMLVLL
jgi:hypothetical protein